ncbi:IclR family transcriptional regulator [Aquabacter sp. CN5-332]|uniref:IclR family transcriptional regulator n=1 Tax=Aquabacter sp. CN5-332 TaxID=3156608 RepID=UPI0032B3E326
MAVKKAGSRSGRAPTFDEVREEPVAEAPVADAKGTIERTLELIQCFGDVQGEWSLSELSAKTELPRSTVHRLLKLMQNLGFVESDEQTRRYRPGPELYRVGAVLAARMPIIPLATPILRHIMQESDETALLSLYYPRQLQKAFVAQVESSRSMRYVIELNVRASLLWGASAHAILAHLDQETIERALAARDPSPVSGDRPNQKELRREIARIRAEGYAWSVGQGVATALGLAVPVFGADGLVKGSVSVTYPESRMDDALNHKLLSLLCDGAEKLSRALGWHAESANSPYALIKVDPEKPIMQGLKARGGAKARASH